MSDEQAKENLITAFISLAEAIHALATSNQTAVLAEISALKDEIAKLTAIGVDIENAEAAAVAAKDAAEQASAGVNTLTGHVLVVRDNQATILAKLDALSAMVTAISATLDEVKASLPVPPVEEPEEPTDPIDPPIDEPVDPEEPTDPETPEVPEEPTEPEVPEEPSPILPIYTMQFPDFTTGEWQGSISKQESRFIVDTSTQHKEVFKVGNVVKFSNGDRRKIVSVLDRYNKLFVGYEGPKLSPEDVGHPHTIEVFASVETPAEPSPTPEQPEPGTGTNIPMGVNVHEGVEPAYPLSQTERRIQMVAAANIRSYRNDMRHIENTAEVNRLINLCRQYGVILRPMLYPTTEAKAYNYAKLFGDRVKVWEIGNEVNLRGRDGAEGRIDALVATYRGMKRASDEFNLGLKFTINVTSCNPNHPSSRCSGDVTGDTWFLDMARARGFLFDYVSFHHYSHFTDSQYWLDLYLGQLRGFAERYNTKIFLNETNAGEVYNGALGSEPIYAQSVRKFLTELNAKYSDVIAEINMYELIDEPHLTVEVEKHFGMFFNIDTPKPVWEVVKEFASQSRAIEEMPGKPQPAPEPTPIEEPPVSYIGTAAKVNAFTDSTTWLKGTFRQKPGFSIPYSELNEKAFAKGAKIELADGQVRRINYSQVVGNNMTLLVDGPQVDAAKVGSPYSIVVTDKEIKEIPFEPVVVEPPVVTPPPARPVTDPNADLVPAFGLNLGGGGNNPWLSVINGIGNDKAGTHYAPTQEIHIKEYVKNLKPGEQWLARLPIAGERLSEKSFDPLHVRYVNEIVAMMDMIHKYNGKVVIDVHNYFRWWKKVDAPIAGRDMKSHNDHLAKGHAVWTVIGEPDSPMSVDGFADFWVKILQSPIGKHPAFFCAGLVNEPHNRSQDGVDVDTKWPLAVPKLIEAVRSVNKDCWIAVAGNFYSSAKAWNVKTAAKMANITDPSDKLLFEAHQYMDQKGDGGGSWKSLSDPVVATQGTQDWAAYVKWLKDNNRRGYCGEVGGPATAGDYLTAARKLCDELFIPNRIPCTFWMGGTGQNDDYANGMNRKDGSLKPNAAPLMERIGIMYKGYGPK